MGSDTLWSAPSAACHSEQQNPVLCTGSSSPVSSSSSLIVVPPLTIDSQRIYKAGSDKAENLLVKVWEILKGARFGADVSSLQVPAQLNLPKSQLQCYAEQVYCCAQNLLDLCADGETPLDRFLAVVRWHISLVRPTPFGKAPYNPILGETHHVTAGDLNLLAEQVSHHPPVSALCATNSKKKLELIQWTRSHPRFYGNCVTVNVEGRKTMTLLEHGETYEMTSAKLNFRLWPSTSAEWVGDTVVKCPQTGYEATVSFKSRSYFFKNTSNQISGKVCRTSSGQTLYGLSGSWDKIVMMEDKESGRKSPLYDGKAALSKLKTTTIAKEQELSPMESLLVWSEVTKGIWNQDWDLAREAKSRVEEAQRNLRKQRAKSGQDWKPKYFTKTPQGHWEWASKGQPVPPAPLTW